MSEKFHKSELSRLCDFRHALYAIADVLKHGENKYKDNLAYLTYDAKFDIDAALRHIMRHDEIDNETGHSHVIHAICRLLFYYNKLNGETVK